MRKLSLKIFSTFMFVVFLSGIMPKELLHDMLFDHDDDVHPVYKKGEVVITKKHNHCSFLSFEFAPFLATNEHFIPFEESVVYQGYLIPEYKYSYTTCCSELSLRGPPAHC